MANTVKYADTGPYSEYGEVGCGKHSEVRLPHPTSPYTLRRPRKLMKCMPETLELIC